MTTTDNEESWMSGRKQAVLVVAILLIGMAVALGAYYFAAALGAGRHLAGGIGGGIGALFTYEAKRRWLR